MVEVFVDAKRCEGAKKCVEVCPEHVFAMQPPGPDASRFLRFRVWVHGGKQAYPKAPERCTACMKCVEVCPEDAIRISGQP